MRKATLIQTGIWYDDEFLELTADAQHVYLMLLTQPTVSHVGVVTLAAGRWATMTSLTAKRFTTAMRELETHDFVLVDASTEELLVRSWVKHNIRGSALEEAAKNQFPVVASSLLRAALQTLHSDLFGDPPPPPPGEAPPPLPPKGLVLGPGNGMGNGPLGEDTSRARVWQAYSAYHPHAKLTPDRQKLIDRSLGFYDDAFLIDAVHGNHLDPHCNGENQRGTEYHDIELILRDAAHIERYAGVKRNGTKPTTRAGKQLARARRLEEAGL